MRLSQKKNLILFFLGVLGFSLGDPCLPDVRQAGFVVLIYI
jgi:hypothetical protein